MAIATVTSKGQVTIPKQVREDLNLTAGSQVMFVRLPDGQYRLSPRTGSVDDWIGILHDASTAPLSIEEIDDAISRGAADSGSRGSGIE